MTDGTGLNRELKTFFVDLNSAVEAGCQKEAARRHKLTKDLSKMFGLLEPTITAATVAIRVMEDRARKEQDRRTGRTFSAFNLVRTQELDLSRIFAGLLDPSGDHSQGPMFLSLLLEELNAKPGEAAAQLQPFEPPGGPNTRVHLEYATGEVEMSGGKRRAGSVDIVLEFDRNRWIGIENKPWAADQREQVHRYLSFLDRHASERQDGDEEAHVILLYWSGDGSDPDGRGLSDEQKLRCLTMPYRQRSAAPSVESWLKRCYVECETERVRSFLHDLLKHIQSQF